MNRYCVVTLHRPSNVDIEDKVVELVENLVQVSHKIPIVFPMHPRTRNNLRKFGKLSVLENESSIHMMEPLGYLEFVSLIGGSSLVITDQGASRRNDITGYPLPDPERKYRATDYDYRRNKSTDYRCINFKFRLMLHYRICLSKSLRNQSIGMERLPNGLLMLSLIVLNGDVSTTGSQISSSLSETRRS